MRPGFEVYLMLLAIGLYLYDSVLLLSANEAVLFMRRRGRWTSGFGSINWTVRTREPYLPNPFTPFRPLFRVAWNLERPDPACAPVYHAVAVPAGAERLVIPVVVLALILFGLFPLSLAFFARAETAIALVVVFYVVETIALVVAYRGRDAFGLSKPQFLTLAVECLFCPPFAINLIRRMCSRMPVDEPFLAAVDRLLDADERERALAGCRKRLGALIDEEGEGSPRRAAMNAMMARLTPVKTR